MTDKTEILIIGGGVSGLSAGIFALKNGHKVTLCEQGATTGGNLTAWKRQGYTIDTCIHWLTGTNENTPLYRMWKELGVLGDDVEIIRPEVLYAVEENGERMTLYRDLDRVIGRMLEISPEDKKQIILFKKNVEAMMGILHTYGPNKDEKLSKKQLLKYLPALLNYYFHNTGEIAGRFKSPLLKKFMRALMGDNFNGIDFAFVAATFVGGNADLPKGLSKPMAERMTKRFLELGGELCLGKKLESVEYDESGHRITKALFNGNEAVEAEHFIFCIDPNVLFDGIIKAPMSKSLKMVCTSKKFKKFSSYHVQFAAECDQLPFTGSLFIDIPEKYRGILKNDRLIFREFEFEPDFAPEGKRTFQAMVYCYEEGCRNFVDLSRKDKEAYRKLKAELAKAINEVVCGRFPELEGKMTVLDVWTPASFNRYTGEQVGNYMASINPKGKMPVRSSAIIKGIDNAYLGSQWQMVPGGLPIAASAGLLAYRTMEMACNKKA